MKKQAMKMVLNKETLRSLTEARLERVAGARPTSLDTRCEYCDTFQMNCTQAC
jgi:hypothetical protein